MAKILILLGVVLAALGLILTYAPWLVDWFGKLPGDINIQDDTKKLFVPITSMIVASIVLTILINLFFRK